MKMWDCEIFIFGCVFGKGVDLFVGKDKKNKENGLDKFYLYINIFCYFFIGRF